MRITLDEGAFMPERAHETDAGLDLRAVESAKIPPRGSHVFDTGVHFELPPNTCAIMISKSGLYFKDSIISTGLVDESYRGSVRVKLCNMSNRWKHIKRGDKISQVAIIPVLYEPLELADELSESDRGENGFGSTGR